MSAPPAPDPETSQPGLRLSTWNLLLLLPLLMLVIPWFNHDGPRLAGWPFFYWSQLAFVPVGVICVWVVYVMTRRKPVDTSKPDLLSVDDLDEGDQA